MNPLAFLTRLIAKPKRRRLRHSSSVTEPLEQRALLTGNVTAEIVDNNLLLTGDDDDNELEVTVFDGNVTVRGFNGTQINGTNAAFVAFANTGTLPGKLLGSFGKGNDRLLLTRGLVVEQPVRIETGSGRDSLGLMSVTLNKDIKAVMGSGQDSVSIQDSVILRKTNLKGSNGNDLFRLDSSDLGGKTFFSSGAHDDTVVVGTTRVRDNLGISTSSGNDTIVVTATRVDGAMDTRTLDGTDKVRMIDSRVAGTTFFGVGSENDQLALGAPGQRNVFTGNFEANGSGGSDDYDEQNNVFKADRKVTRFNDASVNTAPFTAASETAHQLANELGSLFVDRPAETETTVNAIESVGTWITKSAEITVTGTTSNDATIEVDVDGNGSFEDATAQANEHGAFTIALANLDPGRQIVQIRATDAAGVQQTHDLDVHYAIGSVVDLDTSLGQLHIEMLDEDAPLTVENYKSYFDAYENAIVHRSIDGFVVQGGGFEYVDDQIQAIETDDPVENEFNPDNSNLRGTVSTALLTGQPDSATNQWFINLVDNTNLDAAQHTVFGRVIGDGMDIVDEIAGVMTFDRGGAFSDLPVRTARQLSGTLDSNGTQTLTGTDTLFTQELTVGSTIKLRTTGGAEGDFTVVAINSDTEVVLNTGINSLQNLIAFTNDGFDETGLVFVDFDEELFD